MGQLRPYLKADNGTIYAHMSHELTMNTMAGRDKLMKNNTAEYIGEHY